MLEFQKRFTGLNINTWNCTREKGNLILPVMPAKSEYHKLCELMLRYKTDRGEVLKKIGYVYNYALICPKEMRLEDVAVISNAIGCSNVELIKIVIKL